MKNIVKSYLNSGVSRFQMLLYNKKLCYIAHPNLPDARKQSQRASPRAWQLTRIMPSKLQVRLPSGTAFVEIAR